MRPMDIGFDGSEGLEHMDATYGDDDTYDGLASDWTHDDVHASTDRHQWESARGLFFGLAFSVPFWLVVIVAVVAASN